MKKRNVTFSIILILIIICFYTILRQGSVQEISTMSNAQLIEKLQNPADVDLLGVFDEIKIRGPDAVETAPYLAIALSYNRRDSILAVDALYSIGPQGRIAIPNLINVIEDDRPLIRRATIFMLGYYRESSKCALPIVADYLWDPDNYVRSSVAFALDGISGIDLVPGSLKMAQNIGPNGIYEDFPEGAVVGKARSWWQDIGRYMKWGDNNSYCEQIVLNKIIFNI